MFRRPILYKKKYTITIFSLATKNKFFLHGFLTTSTNDQDGIFMMWEDMTTGTLQTH
jgi:hypothetical protein